MPHVIRARLRGFVAFQMHVDHQHRLAAHIDDGSQRDRAADPRFVPVGPEPVAAPLQPDQRRGGQGDVRQRCRAMEAVHVYIARMGALFVHIAKVKLDELDRVKVAHPQPVRQFDNAVPVARPRHAPVDLGQKHHIGTKVRQTGRDVVQMAQPLDIPEHQPGWAVRPVAKGRGAAGFDLAEGRETVEESGMPFRGEGSGPQLLPEGQKDRSDAVHHRSLRVIRPVHRQPTSGRARRPRSQSTRRS